MNIRQTKRPGADRSSGHCLTFDEVYQANSTLVSGLSHRFLSNGADAEDVIQEVWAKVDQKLATLRNSAAIRTWLIRIVVRTAIDVNRSRRPTGSFPSDPPASSLQDPESAVLHSEERRLVWQAIASLTPRQSAALYLREVEGYDYLSIADTLDASLGSVEALLFRARRSLARSYLRLEGSLEERCKLARSVMAVCIDGEGTPIHRKSLSQHCHECKSCRNQLALLHQGTRIHGMAVPVLPQFLALSQAISGSTLNAVSSGVAWIAKLKTSLASSSLVPLAAVQVAAPVLVTAAILSSVALSTGGFPVSLVLDDVEERGKTNLSDPVHAGAGLVPTELIEGSGRAFSAPDSEASDEYEMSDSRSSGWGEMSTGQAQEQWLNPPQASSDSSLLATPGRLHEEDISAPNALHSPPSGGGSALPTLDIEPVSDPTGTVESSIGNRPPEADPDGALSGIQKLTNSASLPLERDDFGEPQPQDMLNSIQAAPEPHDPIPESQVVTEVPQTPLSEDIEEAEGEVPAIEGAKGDALPISEAEGLVEDVNQISLLTEDD